MTEAKIIDGKAFAQKYRRRIAQVVGDLKDYHRTTPGLAVVLVGEDPASQVYVKSKVKMTAEVGMESLEYRKPAETTQEDLLILINGLNNDPRVHGILVQLPLPGHIDEDAIIAAIDPAKDVDGFHVVNVGKLSTGAPDAMVSCTPLGCLMLLEDALGDLEGLNAVVVGRSNIVGKPMAQLLLSRNCTVTVAHSRTRDLPGLCRTADILIAAVGRAEMIKGDWIKPGACVIDVGINRIDAGDGKKKLVGDVDFESAKQVAGAITPVPGGVGPMTIACLLRNTAVATHRQRGLDDPDL